MGNQTTPIAVLIRHRVADYDAWKKAFDDHQGARKAASIIGHDVLRGVDDPDTVYIYFPATDAAKAKAFIDSAELRDAMQNAGVTGPPTITFLTPVLDETVNDTAYAGVVVTHEVEDYDRWKAAYDAFGPTQEKYGIAGHAVNQVLGNPNQVVVYHQGKDHEALRRFIDSPELKEAMQSAGVSSEPDIEFIQSVDLAEY